MKHLAQAAILLQEAQLGYPSYVHYAFGHLAEAESESIDAWPELATRIRTERLQIQRGNAGGVDMASLIEDVSARLSETDDAGR